VPRALVGYDEMYTRRFRALLEANKVVTDDALSSTLQAAAEFESVGDFLADEAEQKLLIAAFGLITLDRIAERWDSLTQEDLFYMHEQLFECFDLCGLSLHKSDEARRRALKGHAKNREAKLFVVKEWVAFREDYEGNKSAFCRDYVKRVANEMGVVVTEKQMREEWLKDIPPAGTPAGL